jgi:hypothetical protein
MLQTQLDKQTMLIAQNEERRAAQAAQFAQAQEKMASQIQDVQTLQLLPAPPQQSAPSTQSSAAPAVSDEIDAHCVLCGLSFASAPLALLALQLINGAPVQWHIACPTCHAKGDQRSFQLQWKRKVAEKRVATNAQRPAPVIIAMGALERVAYDAQTSPHGITLSVLQLQRTFFEDQLRQRRPSMQSITLLDALSIIGNIRDGPFPQSLASAANRHLHLLTLCKDALRAFDWKSMRRFFGGAFKRHRRRHGDSREQTALRDQNDLYIAKQKVLECDQMKYGINGGNELIYLASAISKGRIAFIVLELKPTVDVALDDEHPLDREMTGSFVYAEAEENACGGPAFVMILLRSRVRHSDAIEEVHYDVVCWNAAGAEYPQTLYTDPSQINAQRCLISYRALLVIDPHCSFETQQWNMMSPLSRALLPSVGVWRATAQKQWQEFPHRRVMDAYCYSSSTELTKTQQLIERKLRKDSNSLTFKQAQQRREIDQQQWRHAIKLERSQQRESWFNSEKVCSEEGRMKSLLPLPMLEHKWSPDRASRSAVTTLSAATTAPFVQTKVKHLHSSDRKSVIDVTKKFCTFNFVFIPPSIRSSSSSSSSSSTLAKTSTPPRARVLPVARPSPAMQPPRGQLALCLTPSSIRSAEVTTPLIGVKRIRAVAFESSEEDDPFLGLERHMHGFNAALHTSVTAANASRGWSAPTMQQQSSSSSSDGVWYDGEPPAPAALTNRQH